MTIIDVARAAGVAPSTVSYVLNGKRPISADTRRLVEQSIRQLGYRPHSRRTSAPRQRTGVIGLLAPLHSANTVPTLTRFVGSVMTAAHARDHDLLLLTHGTGMAALRRAVSTAVADALIVTDVQASDPRIPALTALGRPVVLVGEPAQSTGLSCVTLDFDAAAAGVVEHLASLGHRTVGLVGSPLSTTVWGPTTRGSAREHSRLRRHGPAFTCVGVRAGIPPMPCGAASRRCWPGNRASRRWSWRTRSCCRACWSTCTRWGDGCPRTSRLSPFAGMRRPGERRFRSRPSPCPRPTSARSRWTRCYASSRGRTNPRCGGSCPGSPSGRARDPHRPFRRAHDVSAHSRSGQRADDAVRAVPGRFGGRHRTVIRPVIDPRPVIANTVHLDKRW